MLNGFDLKFFSSKSSFQFMVSNQRCHCGWESHRGGVLTLSDHHKAITIVKTAPLLSEMCLSIIPLIKDLQ